MRFKSSNQYTKAVHRIYYDPVTWEWLPSLQDYTISTYNPSSFLIKKVGVEEAQVVDLLDYSGQGSCTCTDFAMRKDPQNKDRTQKHQTCKHLRLVRYILREHAQLQPPQPTL